MKNPIEKEKNKQKQNKVYIIIGAIFYLYAVLVILHYFALTRNDPRMTLEEGIGLALANVFFRPLEIFPISFSSLLYIFLFSIMGAMFLLIAISEKSLKKHDNPETVNGEAHLMTMAELAEYNKRRSDPLGQTSNNGPNNMILSKDIRLAIDGYNTRRNCNVLAVGGSGAGKTRFFAAPNILQFNTNFVITDPSGEMLNDYGKALEDAGYEVLVFNLSDVYRGNRYNPFHYIKEEKDVFILVNTLIKNTTPPEEHTGDPFWEKSEKVFLTASILYLWHKYPEAEQTFTNVTKLISLAQVDENDSTAKSPLDLLFDELEREDPQNLAVEQYKTFKLGAGKTLKSILISVGVRLESFKLSDIQYLTSKDEFAFETFADTKKALFVIIPTADTTFNFLVSLLYSQLFSSLYSYVENSAAFGWQAYLDNLNIVKVSQARDKTDSNNAKREIENFVAEVKNGTYIKFNKKKKIYEVYTKETNTLLSWRGSKEAAEMYQQKLSSIKIRSCPRKCPNHVRFILDEFANIGQIPDFDQKLATIRKYEISCSIIIQAISQLKDLYKDKWNTIAANCDTKLFLGCDDIETIEWLLKMLGKKTTVVENTSWQSNGNGSTSYNRSSIELLTIDQVTMMADDECLVRIRGERPYYGKKYELTAHPNYEYAHKTSGTFEIPLSEYAIKLRQTGPLRLRKNNSAAKNAAATAENNVKAENSPEKEKNTEQNIVSSSEIFVQKKNTPSKKAINEAKSEARKQEAKIAKKELEDFDDKSLADTEEMINAGIMESFGIKAGDSDIEIKEAVESRIILEQPPSDSFSYAITQ